MLKKMTHITGYLTKAAKPDIKSDYDSYKHWQEINFKQYILSGHWGLENAISYAAKKGLKIDIKIEHKVFGFKSWQCGVDARWHLKTIKSMPKKINVTQDDNEGCAQSMLDACEA